MPPAAQPANPSITARPNGNNRNVVTPPPPPYRWPDSIQHPMRAQTLLLLACAVAAALPAAAESKLTPHSSPSVSRLCSQTLPSPPCWHTAECGIRKRNLPCSDGTACCSIYVSCLPVSRPAPTCHTVVLCLQQAVPGTCAGLLWEDGQILRSRSLRKRCLRISGRHRCGLRPLHAGIGCNLSTAQLSQLCVLLACHLMQQRTCAAS